MTAVFLPLRQHDDDQPRPPHWTELARCAEVDTDAFYPEKGESNRNAKLVCFGCEVRAECLEYALANDERWGVWGGLSEKQRRKLKRGVAA